MSARAGHPVSRALRRAIAARRMERARFLPPRYFNGGFACSEPVSFDDERGAETFQCFVRAGRHNLTRVCTIAEAVKEGDLLRFAFGL